MVPATADSAIAVGSYNTRDLNGSFGELSAFSSVGPRIDEEQIIDICAPGNVIFTTNCHNADNSAFGGYHSVSGTSFSAPHVAGATALLLQLDSTLTTYKTKNILRTGAINDNFTGATPNESWGGGKLRILNSLRLLPQFKEQENKSEITPEDFFLFQNYPNPFNSVTTVNFSLPKSSRLTINIYNIKGQLIRTLFNGKGITGTHTLKWDASNLSSGIYFIKMTAEDFIGVKKCTVLK